MVKVYTAQYRYSGSDRLDITTRSKTYLGLTFSPRWEMVKHYKETGDEQKYRDEYHKLILASIENHYNYWQEVLQMERVVLVCFCPAGNFCHRLLVADYLVQLGATYHGEIKL